MPYPPSGIRFYSTVSKRPSHSENDKTTTVARSWQAQSHYTENSAIYGPVRPVPFSPTRARHPYRQNSHQRIDSVADSRCCLEYFLIAEGVPCRSLLIASFSANVRRVVFVVRSNRTGFWFDAFAARNLSTRSEKDDSVLRGGSPRPLSHGVFSIHG